MNKQQKIALLKQAINELKTEHWAALEIGANFTASLMQEEIERLEKLLGSLNKQEGE